MTEVRISAQRFDPYKNYKFRVKFEQNGPYVAGVSKISALKRTSEVIEHRDGGATSTSSKWGGRVKFDPITLERGVTDDEEFEQWANQVWEYGNLPGSPESSEGWRENCLKNITIEVWNEAGNPVVRYHVYNCWVSEYQALPELNANANAVAIQHIKLENEGWVRDSSLA